MRDSFRPIMNKYLSDEKLRQGREEFRQYEYRSLKDRTKMLDPIVDMRSEYQKVRNNRTTIPKSVIRGTTSSR